MKEDTDGTQEPEKITTKTYTQPMKVALTQAEILEQAEQMARAQQEGGQAEADLSSIKKQYAAKIEDAAAAINRAAGLIRDKFWFRAVKCERHLNYTTGRVVELRLDTMEVVCERSMTEDERQMEIIAHPSVSESEGPKPDEAVIAEAEKFIRETNRASVSSLQRKFELSYTMAARVMDVLEERGVVGPANGDTPREIKEQKPLG